MAYITTPGFAGIDLTKATDTTTEITTIPLGTEVQASDGNTYRYVQSVNVAAGRGYPCREDGVLPTNMTTGATGAVPTSIVVPQFATSGTTQHWAVVKGLNYTQQALANCAADVKLYTTTTNGAVDDTATTLLQGVRLNAAAGAGTSNRSASAAGYIEANAQD